MKRAKKAMTSEATTKRKIAEMIAEMGKGFLGAGDTIEERQKRLNAACAAWNMACHAPDVRRQKLDQFMNEYLRASPATSPSDLADLRKDIESLIERKLLLFPEDQRQIIGGKIVTGGVGYRIEVVSAKMQ